MKTSLAVSQAKIQRLRNTESVVERRGLTPALCKELAGQNDELATEAGKFLKLCVDVSESINLPDLKAHNEENTQRINELFHGAKGIDEKKTERKSLRLTPEQESRQSHKAGEVQVLTRPSAVEEAEYLVKRIEPMILHIQQDKETGYTPQGLAVLDAVIKRIEELKNSVEVDMREVIDLGNAGLRTAELTASAALNKSSQRSLGSLVLNGKR